MSQHATCLGVMSTIGLIAVTLAFLSLTSHMVQGATGEVLVAPSCAASESDEGYGTTSASACTARGYRSAAAFASP
jgi:hypothetical protein